MDMKIKQNISVILLISDAMAAILGKRYGSCIVKHRIKYTNNKSI